MHMGLRFLMNRSLWFLEMPVTLRYENHFSLVKRSLDMCIFRGSISHNFRPLKNDAEPGLRFGRFQVSYHWDSQRAGEYKHAQRKKKKIPLQISYFCVTAWVLKHQICGNLFSTFFLHGLLLVYSFHRFHPLPKFHVKIQQCYHVIQLFKCSDIFYLQVVLSHPVWGEESEHHYHVWKNLTLIFQ